MSALVVYESMFGNTQSIAKGIGEGLSSRMTVEIVEVGEAPSVIDPDVELLVVGGPTHAFGMRRPGTRQNAAQQAGHDLVSRGSECASGWPPFRVDQIASRPPSSTRASTNPACRVRPRVQDRSV